MNRILETSSTDKPAPSTNAPGKSRSETTLPSTGKAAPGASLSSVIQSQKSVVFILFAAFVTLLGFVGLMWSGKLDRIFESSRALLPTLLAFVVILGPVLGYFIKGLSDDVKVDATETAEADAAPATGLPGKVVRVVQVPGNYSACECVKSNRGMVVVIHTDEGFIRFHAESLLQSNAIIATDRARMARWIDNQDHLQTNPEAANA